MNLLRQFVLCPTCIKQKGCHPDNRMTMNEMKMNNENEQGLCCAWQNNTELMSTDCHDKKKTKKNQSHQLHDLT